jgi:hypothetical protein
VLCLSLAQREVQHRGERLRAFSVLGLLSQSEAPWSGLACLGAAPRRRSTEDLPMPSSVLRLLSE